MTASPTDYTVALMRLAPLVKAGIFFAFLVTGIRSVAAQDMIVLRYGNIIDAEIEEVSKTEIRYKPCDNLDGPIIAIPLTDTLSIRYENGDTRIFNATAMDPDKFVFGFNANPIGLLSTFGPTVGFELGKGGFNTEINLMFPSAGLIGKNSGFGGLATFNRFWHSRIGGFYLGGGMGYTKVNLQRRYSFSESYYQTYPIFIFGANAGYKFVTRSGIYFRTGSFVGYGVGWGFYAKPDLTIGWTMK